MNHPIATPETNPTSRRRKLALTAGLCVGSIGAVAGINGGSASAIVDGDATTIEANPWQAALTTADGQPVCGGSIVSPRVIVTAAHCTLGTDAADMAVRVGATDLSTNDGQTRSVSAVVEHPKYVNGVGDIALLVLAEPLDMSDAVQAIELASSGEIVAGDSARVTGWGVTDENGDSTPSVLQTTELPLVADADCSLVDEGNADELCAGGTGTDSCYGDSGGPLTVATDEGRKLAGVVSWGDECGGESAGVYAEVPTFASWIADRIDDPDAPAGDRLPIPDDGGATGDDGTDAVDGEVLEIDDAFVESVGGWDALEAMSDTEFFDAYEAWIADGNVAEDGISEEGDADEDGAEDGISDGNSSGNAHPHDTNGDDIVQWSELNPNADSSADTNGDGIVNWSELVDA